MERGVMFTYDAILAVGITLLLFSALTLLNDADYSQGSRQLQNHTKAADNALINFHKNVPITSASTSLIDKNCEQIYEYDDKSISEKSTGCSS